MSAACARAEEKKAETERRCGVACVACGEQPQRRRERVWEGGSKREMECFAGQIRFFLFTNSRAPHAACGVPRCAREHAHTASPQPLARQSDPSQSGLLAASFPRRRAPHSLSMPPKRLDAKTRVRSCGSVCVSVCVAGQARARALASRRGSPHPSHPLAPSFPNPHRPSSPLWRRRRTNCRSCTCTWRPKCACWR